VHGSGRAVGTLLGTLAALAGSSAVAWAATGPPADPAARAIDARSAQASLRRTGPAPVSATRAAAAAALGRDLGGQGVVRLDPATGTPRQVARLDGFLTGSTAMPPAKVALGYVQSHPALFGLDAGDVDGLRKAPEYRSIDGTTHVQWRQEYRGVPVFANGLRANVDRFGRLINVQGSPVPDVAVPSVDPGLSGAAALARARGDLRLTGSGDVRDADPTLTIFHLPGADRLAWHLWVKDGGDHEYETVVDATNGRTLFRQDIVTNASASGSRWRYVPSSLFDAAQGLADGHTAQVVEYPDSWGPGANGGPLPADRLQGNNAHTYSDLNDDDQINPGEEVPATGSAGGRPQWNHPFTNFGCSVEFPCSWDLGDQDASILKNRGQNAQQVFWFVNDFHDHLAAAPFGFTEAAGNFEAVNATGQGKAGDAVDTQSDDGALTDRQNGGPDTDHLTNANMATREDGVPPRMQMYLFAGDNGTVTSNGGDEADIVYHEYVHGLTNRLVHDAQGFPRLDGQQSRSMGEGWSDFYAMDYLVARNLDSDTSAGGDVKLGFYVSGGDDLIRSEGIDCKVGETAAACNGGRTGRRGGYTLADFGKVVGEPEVHGDGEIWAQTLWQIRQALQTGSCPGGASATCSTIAQNLVTRALELSPPAPSMLDQRDAIIQADQVAYGGAHLATLWAVFAQRGMGFFAADLGSGDVKPVASFSTPPQPSAATGTISGAIVDVDGRAPVVGATVMLTNHANLSARTDAAGRYAINGVPPGVYPYLVAVSRGYDGLIQTNVDVTPGANARDLQLRRNWAASSLGGTVTASEGPDLTSFGCGPGGAVDESDATGWGNYRTDFAGGVDGLPPAPLGPRSITIRLPQAVDVKGLGIDPGATCGDDPTASLGQYRLEFSPDGTSFAQVAAGTFGAQNNYTNNPVTPTGQTAGVRFVRLSMLGNQGGDGRVENQAYQRFLDMTELEVYGTPAAPAPPAPAPPPPSASPDRPLPPAAPPPGTTISKPPAPFSITQLTKGKGSLRQALRRGVRIKLTCRAACAPKLVLSVPTATARRLKLGRRAVVVARGSVKLAKAGSRVVVLRLARKYRRRLGRARSVSFSLSVSSGGKTVHRTLVLRR